MGIATLGATQCVPKATKTAFRLLIEIAREIDVKEEDAEKAVPGRQTSKSGLFSLHASGRGHLEKRRRYPNKLPAAWNRFCNA